MPGTAPRAGNKRRWSRVHRPEEADAGARRRRSVQCPAVPDARAPKSRKARRRLTTVREGGRGQGRGPGQNDAFRPGLTAGGAIRLSFLPGALHALTRTRTRTLTHPLTRTRPLTRARTHAHATPSRARARTRQLPDNGDPAGLTFAPPAVPATGRCASDAILLKNIFSGRFCPCEVTDQASRAFRRWPLRPGGLRGPAVVSRVFPPAACAYPMIFPGRCSAGCRRGLGGLRSCGWNGFQVCT